MPIDPMVIDLIRRFEPILYFHKQETFFPSDAKRYIEQCALWEAKAPFQNKSSWKERIPSGEIAAAINEISQPGHAVDTYLGLEQMDGTHITHPFLVTDDKEERFLNPSGWINDSGTHEDKVTSTTRNRYAALELLARWYDISPSATGAIPELRDSCFWYHAETFDKDRLVGLTQNETFPIPNGSKLLDRFNEPFLICYYLFYPGHIEGLQGCETVETGQNFGSFAGEWTCVSILLDLAAPNPSGGSTPTHVEAKFLGLASRNANKNGDAGVAGRELDAEKRVGMVIYDWSEIDVDGPTSSPEHVKLFVAKGTHSLYKTPGSRVLQPKDPGDPTRGSCGFVGSLPPTIIPDPRPAGEGEVFLAKVVASAGVLGGLGSLVTGGAVGLIVGVVAGIVWSVSEDKPFVNTPFGTKIPPPTTDEPQMDLPPEDGQFGFILHPGDFVPHEVSPQHHTQWPAEETIELNHRKYSILVDRINQDETMRQVWFPPATSKEGYKGRWGPRVTPDPSTQRSGMQFPAFVVMFLKALAKELSKNPSP